MSVRLASHHPPRRFIRRVRTLVLVFAAWAAGPLDAQLLTRGDFETGDLSQFRLQGAHADSLTVVSSPARAGQHAGRSLLRAIDPKVSSGLRAEWVDRAAAPLGEVHWYALSVHAGGDFTVPARSDGIVFQFHQHARTGSPVLAFRVVAGNWRITSDATARRRTLAVVPFESGRWTDWVVRVKWNTGPTGEWTIWKDGTQLLLETGVITTRAGETAGPYAKFGQYHTVDEAARNVLHFDEYRHAGPASTYEDVAPGRARS